MAAALAIFVRTSLRSEFRRIDPTSARIVLIDAARNVLGHLRPSPLDAAEQHLQKLGVEIHLGQAVEKIDRRRSHLSRERIARQDRDLDAGVNAFPVGKWLGVETDRPGRVRIQPDLRVPNHRRFSWSAIRPRSIRTENRWRASLKLQCNKDAMLEIDSAPAYRKRPPKLFVTSTKAPLAVVGKGTQFAERQTSAAGLIACWRRINFPA